MKTTPACMLALILTATTLPAAELRIGGATTSITPDQPVALDGHRNPRISNKIESPVTATVLAWESRDGDKVLDQAIMVSLDLVGVRDGILNKVREKVKPRLADFDVRKLFMNATHTHNAPVTLEGRYTLPEKGNMKPAEYTEFMTTKVPAQGLCVAAATARSSKTVGSALKEARSSSNARSKRSRPCGPRRSEAAEMRRVSFRRK